MLQFTPLQTTDKDYSFVENLLHESFPEAERRDDVAQRDNVDNCAAFTCYMIFRPYPLLRTDGEVARCST